MLSELAISAGLVFGGQIANTKCEVPPVACESNDCVCENCKCDGDCNCEFLVISSGKNSVSVSVKTLKYLKVDRKGNILLVLKSGREKIKNWRKERGPLKKQCLDKEDKKCDK